MKREAHGTQQPRHINRIGEGASTAQRSDSLVQSINQRFPKEALINSIDKIRCKADGAQEMRHIMVIGEFPSAIQRSRSLVIANYSALP